MKYTHRVVELCHIVIVSLAISGIHMINVPIPFMLHYYWGIHETLMSYYSHWFMGMLLFIQTLKWMVVKLLFVSKIGLKDVMFWCGIDIYNA